MILQGSNIGIIKRDAGSLDYSSHRPGVQGLHQHRSQTLERQRGPVASETHPRLKNQDL